MTGRIKEPTNTMCDLLGSFFTTLAHRTRMRIFCALMGAPKTVTRIAYHAGISVANASQHLRHMRDNGAVLSEKRSQSVYYRISDQRFVQAAILIREVLAENSLSQTCRDRHRFSKNMNPEGLILIEEQSSYPPHAPARVSASVTGHNGRTAPACKQAGERI